MKFDLVINVAEELKCPFDLSHTKKHGIIKGDLLFSPMSSIQSVFDDIKTPLDSKISNSFSNSISIHNPNSSSNSNVDVNQNPDAGNVKIKTYNHPQGSTEYLHVAWSHSTHILPALPYITSIISDRLSLNKRILIHCQFGVSRSATLLIAAVMKIQKLSVKEAYDVVQSKANEIGPNMGLIFELADWEKELKRQNTPLISININEDDESQVDGLQVNELQLQVNGNEIQPNDHDYENEYEEDSHDILSPITHNFPIISINGHKHEHSLNDHDNAMKLPRLNLHTSIGTHFNRDELRNVPSFSEVPSFPEDVSLNVRL